MLRLKKKVENVLQLWHNEIIIIIRDEHCALCAVLCCVLTKITLKTCSISTCGYQIIYNIETVQTMCIQLSTPLKQITVTRFVSNQRGQSKKVEIEIVILLAMCISNDSIVGNRSIQHTQRHTHRMIKKKWFDSV